MVDDYVIQSTKLQLFFSSYLVDATTKVNKRAAQTHIILTFN